MKFDFVFKLVMGLMLTGLAACSSIEEIENEDGKKICPDVDNLFFTASAVSGNDIRVMAKAGEWDAVSDQDWCKVEKHQNNFSVNAEPSDIFEKRTATISVSRKGVVKQEILVEQIAAAKGEVNPNDNFWDDTHWRLFELKGRVKTFYAKPAFDTHYYLEFNRDGKVSYFVPLMGTGELQPGAAIYDYEYDYRGRLMKEFLTVDGTKWLSREFIYGESEKYVPLFLRYHLETPAWQNFMWKGISGFNRYDKNGMLTESINFIINQNKVTYTISGYTCELEYDGSNLPKSNIIVGVDSRKKFTYKYSSNARFADVLYENDYRGGGFTDIMFYDIADGSYLRFIKSHELAEGETPATISRPAYVERDKASWTFDGNGNWTHRPAMDSQYSDRRTITYYE